MKFHLSRTRAWVAMFLLSAASSALAQQPPPAARPARNPADAARVKQAMQEAAAALTAKDHAGALQALQSYLALAPNDPKALYNAACMAALTGESEQSLAYLDQAVSAGFLSFSRLASDSDLDAIRNLPAYRALVARQEEILRADADRKATQLAAKYGPSFRITRLDDEHVLFRLPMLIRVWEANKMPPLSALFKQGFGDGSPLDYGRARYVMYFLQEKGLLDTWYAEYRRSYAADPSGVKAIEKVYGKDLASFEQEWSTFCQAAYHKQVAEHAAKTAKPPATNTIPPTTTGGASTER